MHRHALNRRPEARRPERVLGESTQDREIADRFGAAGNLVGRPWRAGDGSEKNVYFSKDPNAVVAVHKREWHGGRKFSEIDLTSPEERAKFIRRKCVGEIISILYPEKAARIQRTATRYGVTISERISGNQLAPRNKIFQRLIFQLRMRSLGFRIDKGEYNFRLRGENNSITYVDTIYEGKPITVIFERLKKAISEAELDAPLRARAMHYLERYRKLIPKKVSNTSP